MVSSALGTEPLLKRDDLEARWDLEARFGRTDHREGRDPAGRAQGGHATDHLSVERLRVEVPLAGHHQLGVLDRLWKTHLIRNELEPLDQSGADRGESTRQTARCAREVELGDVHTVLVPVHLSETFQPSAEQLHLPARRALLGGEHLSCVDEAGPHVTGDLEIDTPKSRERDHGTERTQTAVGGRRSAQAHDDASGARLDRRHDQLARAVGARGERVVARWPTHQRQARRLGHLDHRGPAREPPTGLDRVAEWTGHRGDPVWAAQGIEGALATIGERNRPTVPTRIGGDRLDRRADVAGRRRTAELVGCNHDGRAEGVHDRAVWHPRRVGDVAEIVIVSNRGPVSFELDGNGVPRARRGAGGLASGLAGLRDRGATWVAVASTEGDRAISGAGPVHEAGFDLQLVDLDPVVRHHHYDVISNDTLWFLHHGLLRADPSRFDERWRAAWQDYVTANEVVGAAVAEFAPPRAQVLVQDYHFSLLGRILRDARPDLQTVHFHHTPFCSAAELAVLPPDVAGTLIESLCSFDACGFHVPRWAARFAECVADRNITPPATFDATLGVDAAELLASAETPEVRSQIERMDQLRGDRVLVVRVDRIDPSKNLVRGFEAFDLLLERFPQWRQRVVFGAFCYPSRMGLDTYVQHASEVRAAADRVNDRWASGDWTPVVLETDDDYPRSLAGLVRSDVLLVNPVRDGLNLVAKEGAIVNDRAGGLVLSRNAGVFDELETCCDPVDPFDVDETAVALHTALARSPDARLEQAHLRRMAASSRTPADWLADQLRMLS